VHDRQSRWKERVTSATAALRRDLTDLRERECTFRPAINRRRATSSPHARRNARGGEGVDVTVSECSDDEYGHRELEGRHGEASDVFSRLHTHSESIRQRREQMREEKAAEASKCTFRPRVVRSGWTEAVQPRYLDPRSNSCSHVSDERDGRGTVLHGFHSIGAASTTGAGTSVPHGHTDDDCTFAPVTNPAKSPFMAEYLRQPVHERLHQSPGASKKRKQVDGSDVAPSPSAGRRALTPSQLRGFEERLTHDIERRRWKAQTRQREAEQQRPTFQPRTTRYARLDKMSQEERDRLVEQRQMKLEEERRRLDREMRPKAKGRFVSPHSRKLLQEKPQLQRPLVERFKESAARKADRLEAQRRKLEEDELAELRPAPENVARPPPDAQKPPTSELSKALGGGDYRAYLEALERKKRKRLEETAHEVEAARQAALKECTFRPEVHEAPEYIRQIAHARSMSRQDTSHCGHHAHEIGRRRSSSAMSAGNGPTTTGRMVLDSTPVRL